MEAEPGKAPCPNAHVGPAARPGRSRGRAARTHEHRLCGRGAAASRWVLGVCSLRASMLSREGCVAAPSGAERSPLGLALPPRGPYQVTCREEVPSVLADSALAPPDAPGTPTHPGPCAAGAAGWSCFGRAAVPGGSVPSRRLWVVPLRCRRQGKSPAENKAHPSGPFHSVPINPSSATVSHARRT